MKFAFPRTFQEDFILFLFHEITYLILVSSVILSRVILRVDKGITNAKNWRLQSREYPFGILYALNKVFICIEYALMMLLSRELLLSEIISNISVSIRLLLTKMLVTYYTTRSYFLPIILRQVFQINITFLCSINVILTK